ncbi:MAG: SusE domain-containing protein [Ferruginibacter sp.]
MKKSFNILLAAAIAMFSIAGCDKADDIAMHNEGVASVLSSSATSIAPAAADSDNVVMVLSWTSPKYATDTTNYKYIIEIDSVTKNFSNPLRKEVVGDLTTSFIAKELNTFLVNRSYAFNTPVSMEVRMISSYVNNNERIVSNVVPFTATPYKVPPKVALPVTSKLFIVGSSTQGSWDNPVPVPTQELARLDETTWGGIFEIVGGGQYLILPENGSWDNKFSVQSNTAAADQGDFGFNLPNNFNGPSSGGWYKIILDFQTGRYKVTPYTGVLPTNLFIVGDATPGAWANPVPVPSQQLTRLNASQWSVTLNFTGTGEYLLLPQNGSWDSKYAVDNNTLPNLWKGGELKFFTSGGANFPGPNTAGSKTLLVDFATKEDYAVGKFTVTP